MKPELRQLRQFQSEIHFIYQSLNQLCQIVSAFIYLSVIYSKAVWTRRHWVFLYLQIMFVVDQLFRQHSNPTRPKYSILSLMLSHSMEHPTSLYTWLATIIQNHSRLTLLIRNVASKSARLTRLNCSIVLEWPNGRRHNVQTLTLLLCLPKFLYAKTVQLALTLVWE